MQGTICLPGIGEGRYPLSQLGEWGIVSEGDHLVQGLLDLVMVVNGYLPLGMLDRGNRQVSMDCICAGHVSYGVKGEGQSTFKG